MTNEEILSNLAQASMDSPYRGKIFQVGGSVRDELLGLAGSPDMDFACELDPLPFLDRLVELGIASGSVSTYERFGTAMVQVDGCELEFATMRAESYDVGSRKPKVQIATLDEDALRRDFTVNALYKGIEGGPVLDPTKQGLQDLKFRVLRTPVDPSKTFFDDPLRMLRAVRLKWKLGFEFADGLAKAITANADRMSILSPERIQGEFVAILSHPTGPNALQELLNLGLLRQFIPELELLSGVDQGAYHHLDVWNHTLLVMTRLWELNRADSDTVLSALFHDIGKPQTRTVEASGKIRFFGHEVVGKELTEKIMKRLRFSEARVQRVAFLVGAHMRLGHFHEFGTSGIRRLIRDMGDLLEPLLNLVEADSQSLSPDVQPLNMAEIRRKIDEVSKETPRSSLESPLDGKEIEALLNIAPGPAVGKAKAFLLARVLDGDLLPGDKILAKAILLQNWPSLADKSLKN